MPTSLFDLIIGGMVNSSLVPVFSDYAEKEKRDELWQVLSMVLSAATLVLLGVIAIVELLAPQVAWLVGAANFAAADLSEFTITLIRMTTPAVFFLGIASILRKPVFRTVKGKIEFQRKRSGDALHVLLMLDEQTYWFFSYTRGQMLVYSSDVAWNTMLSELKEDKMKQDSKKDEAEYRFMLTGKRKVDEFRDRFGL